MRITDEHISAFLDEELPHDQRAVVENHLRKDTALAAEYRAVQAVKMLLNNRTETLRPSVPADARHAVLLSIEQEWYRSKTLDRIDQESKRQEAGKIDEQMLQQPSLSLVGNTAKNNFEPPQKQHIRSTFKVIGFLQKRPYFLVAALVLIIAGWFGLRLFVPSTGNSNVLAKKEMLDNRFSKVSYEAVFIKESLRNYHAVCEGKITLQYKTNSYEELDKFFHANGIHYNIVHPKINADLLGGVVSEEDGKKSVHLVFKHGDRLLYMWEIDLDDAVIRHTSLQENVWNLLRKGEWLWDTATEDSTTVVFWEDDKQGHRTLCSVVATLPRKDLQPLFQ